MDFFLVMIAFITDMDKKSFQFKVNNKSMIWHYKRYFNCDSKNVIYILMYNTSKWFYLGPDKLPIQSREIESINQMFFIPRIVFVRNNQNIYTIVVEWKNYFWEFTYFYMRIKKNYASLKKTFHYLLETTYEYLSINR